MNFNKERVDAFINFFDFQNLDAFRKPESLNTEGYNEQFPRISTGISKLCFIFDDVVLKVSHSRRRDDCAIECDNYKAAKEKGVDIFFPETEFYAGKNGVNFFVQEKVNCNPHSEQMRSARHMNEIDRVRFLMQDYDEEDVEKLIDFIQLYGIRDLSIRNFGHRSDNGRCVIVDFCGV